LALDWPDAVHSLALLEPALMAGASGQGYRESLKKGAERFQQGDAAEVLDAFLELRWPGYREPLERALPGAFAQAVADAGTWFKHDFPGLLEWRFGEDEARRIGQPVLSLLGGESDALWSRFGEVHRLLLEWLPHAEGHILPGATHFMQVEDPRGVSEALSAFWGRHPISTRSA
jgi:pimeloyl-ACP methyl ester carboxylesterase